MDVLVIAAPVLFGACLVAFQLGQYTKEHPTEDEMIDHLINARVQRKLASMTTDRLESELNDAVSKRVAS
jgi:hypothetical protein